MFQLFNQQMKKMLGAIETKVDNSILRIYQQSSKLANSVQITSTKLRVMAKCFDTIRDEFLAICRHYQQNDKNVKQNTKAACIFDSIICNYGKHGEVLQNKANSLELLVENSYPPIKNLFEEHCSLGQENDHYKVKLGILEGQMGNEKNKDTEDRLTRNISKHRHSQQQLDLNTQKLSQSIASFNREASLALKSSFHEAIASLIDVSIQSSLNLLTLIFVSVKHNDLKIIGNNVQLCNQCHFFSYQKQFPELAETLKKILNTENKAKIVTISDSVFTPKPSQRNSQAFQNFTNHHSRFKPTIDGSKKQKETVQQKNCYCSNPLPGFDSQKKKTQTKISSNSPIESQLLKQMQFGDKKPNTKNNPSPLIDLAQLNKDNCSLDIFSLSPSKPKANTAAVNQLFQSFHTMGIQEKPSTQSHNTQNNTRIQKRNIENSIGKTNKQEWQKSDHANKATPNKFKIKETSIKKKEFSSLSKKKDPRDTAKESQGISNQPGKEIDLMNWI